jgi:hypothetical protein
MIRPYFLCRLAASLLAPCPDYLLSFVLSLVLLLLLSYVYKDVSASLSKSQH